MKTVCSILIVALFVHLQCGGSCLAESLKSMAHPAQTAEPPCHKHADTPSGSSQSSHETQNPCAQPPVVEAKSTVDGKYMQVIAVLPAPTQIVAQAVPFVPALSAEISQVLWSPQPSVSVLRI